jgi:hypothetical protein
MYCKCGNLALIRNYYTNEYEVATAQENSVVYLGNYGYVEYEEAPEDETI